MTTIWEAIEARDEGIARVEERSAPWRAVAADAVRAVARRQRLVRSADVWTELDAMRIPRPPEGRAMGAVMVKAVRDGLIEPWGYERGSDPKHHRDIQQVFRSRIYGASEADLRAQWGDR